MKINIGIDFDGTITNYRKFEEKYFKKHFNLKIKNPLGLSFSERYGVAEEDTPKYMENYYKAYFNNIKVRWGVRRVINSLRDKGYIVNIITNRSEMSRDYLVKFFEKNDIIYNNLYCLGRPSSISKADKLKELGVDIMFEDNNYQIESISEFIPVIAIDNYYNRHISKKNVYRVKYWRQVPKVMNKIL